MVIKKKKDEKKEEKAEKAQSAPVQEEPADAVPEEQLAPEEKIKTPEDIILGLSSEVAEWKDKYLRAMADFDNYRKRTLQEKSEWMRYATEKLILTICEVLDNFERAMLQLREEHHEDNVIKGFLMIEQQLRSILDKEGVKKIEALGAEFDPKFHEALASIPSEKYPENTVAAVIQNGYTMHGKVVRPVRVAVSTGEPLKEIKDIEIEKE